MVRASGTIRRVLVDAKVITPEDWSAAREGKGAILDVLVDRGVVGEGKLLATLARAAKTAPVDLSRAKPDPKAVKCLPPDVCHEHCVLPLAKNGEVVTVAVPDPFDVLLLDDLTILAEAKVRAVIALPSAIKRQIEAVFDRDKKQVDALMGQVGSAKIEVEGDEDAAPADLSVANVANAEDVPAVKLVNLMLSRALRDKASDIHIEPLDKSLRIRFRIDGRLVEIMQPPKSLGPSVMSRLKILASLDIAIRMEPQDGKFQIRYEGRTIDFRLSTLPVVGGEKAVMRILDQSGIAAKLDALGFEPRCLEDMMAACSSAYGMLLVTGPTGSGKSTTLYASVREVATPEINVVTVEDPVEYRMNGINQVPVNPKRGLTFAGALRSILRQDPDVVLVGEIRDAETAEIAIKAALTGHLVLSTLHTNDAPGAVTRLVDMGIDPFLVSSSVICVAAQRLVRQLCTHCKKKIELPDRELLAVGYQKPELKGIEIFGPGGCARCQNGYRGRFALLETLRLTEELKRMVVEGRSQQELKAAGLKQGMVTLRRAGLENVKRGRTSLEEVLRVTVND